MAFYDELMAACQAQATWMENSVYQWQNHPTVPKSYYKGTCVTYVACVLQRVNILQPGEFIWHNSAGMVVGANGYMTVMYPHGNLHSIKNMLAAGDIVMDGSASDLQQGSHIFIITGQWNGNNPIVWDNHSGQQRRGAYEYKRNRPVIAVVRLEGAIPFVPRLSSSGMMGNPYWYSRNPFYLAGYGLPNCTCYAWGRAFDLLDTNRDYSNPPTLSTGNAEDWYGYTQDGYERGSTPRLGAIACWADGPFSGDGHVAVVEEIDPDTGVITCSNSAYGGRYFYITHLSPPNYLPAAGYVFQGFIYIPVAGGAPWWWASKKIWLWKKWWWNRERELIQ